MKINVIQWAIALCAFVVSISSVMAQQAPSPIPSPTISPDPGPLITTPTPTPTPPLPDPPYAIITYPAADSTSQSVSVVAPCTDGVFSLVGLQPDQVVQVVIHYSTDQALQLVDLEALDGGTLLPPTPIEAVPPPTPAPTPCESCVLVSAHSVSLSLVISAEGTLSFTFRATHDPGKNQIALRQNGQEFGVQIWVFDQEEPETNPPAITASNPYPAAFD